MNDKVVQGSMYKPQIWLIGEYMNEYKYGDNMEEQ